MSGGVAESPIDSVRQESFCSKGNRMETATDAGEQGDALKEVEAPGIDSHGGKLPVAGWKWRCEYRNGA